LLELIPACSCRFRGDSEFLRLHPDRVSVPSCNRLAPSLFGFVQMFSSKIPVEVGSNLQYHGGPHAGGNQHDARMFQLAQTGGVAN